MFPPHTHICKEEQYNFISCCIAMESCSLKKQHVLPYSFFSVEVFWSYFRYHLEPNWILMKISIKTIKFHDFSWFNFPRVLWWNLNPEISCLQELLDCVIYVKLFFWAYPHYEHFLFADTAWRTFYMTVRTILSVLQFCIVSK